MDKVEIEDELVAENVLKRLGASFYEAGRFSLKIEKGVHYFHGLLVEFLNNSPRSP